MRATILEFLRRPDRLRGRTASLDECRLLMESLKCDASHLCALMSLCPLIGTTYSRNDDANGSFDLQWMNAAAIIDEATGAFPGIAALNEGYIPVGSCMLGTGDPYFIRSAEHNDPALYMIRHDLSVEEERREDCVLLPGAVSVVLPRLELLLDFVV